MNPDNIEKKFIVLDTSTSNEFKINQTDKADFTFTLQNEQKNVIGIKHADSYVLSDSTNFSNLDNIYIAVNDFDLIETCNSLLPPIFCDITVNKLTIPAISTNPSIQIFAANPTGSGNMREREDTHYCNPTIPKLTKLNVRLYNTKGELLEFGENNQIRRLILKICIYTSFAKKTMV
jgi:hypothetical protein